MQNCSTERNNVTFTTSIPSQCQVAAQCPQNNMRTNHTSTNFQNKTPHAYLNSTSYNNTTTFINRTEAAPPQTTTAIPPNVSLQAPANYTFRPSFSSIPQNTITSNLTHQQIN